MKKFADVTAVAGIQLMGRARFRPRPYEEGAYGASASRQTFTETCK
jgi:hypothetical protein